MKKIITILLLFYAASFASVVYVQGKDSTNDGGTTTIKIAYPSNVTAGNSLFLDVHGYGSNASHSVSDKLGNTVSLIDTVYYVSQTEKITRWRIKSTTGGADTFTVTFGASLSYWRCIILEYSGLDTASLYYDTKDSINASLAANNQTGKVKIFASGDLVLSSLQSTCSGATVSAGSGFTMRKSTSGGLNYYIEDFITSNTDSVMGQWTNSSGAGTCWLALTTSFKAAAITPDSGSLSLTDITNNKIFQRLDGSGNPGGTQCSVSVAGTCKKYTGALKALLRHSAGDTVLNWTTIATSPDSGSFSKKISAPSGCWYKLSICDDLGDTVHGSNRFGVGDIWLVIGQSNIMGWVSDLRGNANDTASDSVVNFSRLTWQRMIDPMLTSHGATPFIKLGNMLARKRGYPHAFVNTAIGGTAINGDWNDRHVPLSDTSYKYNRAYTYAQLAGGKIFGIIMGQGERDAELGTNKQTYMDQFDSVMTRFRSDLSYSNMPVFYFQVGRFQGYATDANVAIIQDAQLTLENHSKKYYLSTAWWDLPMSGDLIHLDVSANDTLGKRFGVSISRWYDGTISTYPKISTIVNSGLNVVKVSTTASQLATLSQIPNFAVTYKNDDAITNTGISISGNILYDTLSSITKRKDTLKAYYAASTVPSATYVLKDTGGYPLPQVWGPVLFDNTSAVPVIDSVVPTHGLSGSAIKLWGSFAVTDTILIDGVKVNYTDSENIKLSINVPTHNSGSVNIIDKNFVGLTDTISWAYDRSNRIWSSTGSTNANDSANYTGSGLLLSTDTLSLNNTSAINYALTSNLFCGKLVEFSNYTGNISLGTYTLSTTNGGAIFNGTGTLNLGAGITASGTSDSIKIAAGVGAVTATNAAISFAGAGSFVDSKGITASLFGIQSGAKVVSTGAGVTIFEDATPLTMGTNTKLTVNTASSMSFRRTTSGSIFARSGNWTDTIAGATTINFRPTNDNLQLSLPGILYTGTGSFFLSENLKTGGKFTITDSVSIPNSAALQSFRYGASALAVDTLIFQNVNVSIPNGIMATGANNSTCTSLFKFGSGTFNVGSYEQTTYNTGTINDSMQSSVWRVGGSITCGSAHNVYPGTSAWTVINTSTVTSANKTFANNFTSNAAGKVITFADKFRCSGDFTATAGKITFANKARDSIGGSYTNALTGTDSISWNADSCWIGANFTGGLRTKSDFARKYPYGTALCNFTSNGTIINHFDIRGDSRAKQVKLIDKLHIRKAQVTTGTLNTNGQDFFADSFFICNDSIATILGDTISAPKITFGASAKPSLTVPMQLFFGLALKDTLYDTCARSIGKLTENKTGDTLTLSGVTHLDTLQIVDGGLRMASATDTVYCKGLSWTSTDPSTIIAPIVVSDSIYIVAGASITYSGVGRIIKLTCSSAQGGNAARIYYPTIAPIIYSGNPWIDYIGVPSTHAITIGGCALGKDSIVTITALPTGYSYSKTTGLISWDGTGTAQTAASYVLRAYANSKTDSASVTLGITISVQTSKRRNRGALSCGRGIGVE